MKYPKFSHKTPHLKGKQHQLDPNLDLKQLVHHSTVQYVDMDADGDVDVYDNPKKGIPDENPTGVDAETVSKKLIAKQKGEVKHTKRGIAYEDLRRWFSKDHPEGNWKRYNTKGEAIGPCAREPGEPKPKCLSNEKAAKMSKDEIAAAVRRKRKADPVADRPGKGGKPKMVSNKIEEQSEEKRYCIKCKKMETRDECSYGPEMWDKMTIKNFNEAAKKDHEYSMARSQLSTVMNAAKRLKKKMAKGEGEVEAWVQSKITKAADYLDAAADYIDSGEHDIGEEKDPCWTGYIKVGMKKKRNKMVPNCVPEEVDLEEENRPTNPKLWAKWKAKAKAKFDVYPSAYANGWAAKGYKSEGGGWKSVKEETIEDANGNTFAEVIDLIKPEKIKGFKSQIEEAVRIPAKTGNIILVTLNWRGKLYMIKLFFPQTTKPNRQEVQNQIEKIYPGSRVQSYHISEIKPGEQFLQVEDWQKKNRNDKTDGMSQDAVDEYRKENRGSKLQTAVTEKNPKGKRAKRRKNFCIRSAGQRDMHNIDCSKTPDKPICKARRRWRCK